jgi:hypothetical protein
MFPVRSSFACHVSQPGDDALAEGVVELPPSGGEGRAAGEVAEEGRAQSGQRGGEDAPVGFGEQDGDRAAVGCELVAVGAGSRSMICLRRSRRRS